MNNTVKKTIALQVGLLVVSLLSTKVLAAVSAQEAAQLGTSLTPLGAQKEGNVAGSIPAWKGGLGVDAAAVENGFLSNPFDGEKPQFVITAKNAGQYKAQLSEGQLAMFARYPDSYRIPVYSSQRTASSPQNVYDAAKKSALTTESLGGGNGLKHFEQSRYYAFPIPKTGVEVIWNHITRYRGINPRRYWMQATPQVNGAFTAVQFEDEAAFPQYITDADPQKEANVLYYYKQSVISPARLAGNVVLLHETIDQIAEPRRAWAYNAGQRRVRRAPQIAYDGPGTAADGMRTADNSDLFNGSPDRYDWKLVGKREMYIPYNNYALQSPTLKYTQIIQPGHINQDLTRYELHRVWEIEATLKPTARNIYAKRRFYVDEDTWTAVLSEHYDGRGQLWRVGEGFQMNNYQQGISIYAATTLYDLVAGRYMVDLLSNEAKHGPEYGRKPLLSEYAPAALRNAGIR